MGQSPHGYCTGPPVSFYPSLRLDAGYRHDSSPLEGKQALQCPGLTLTSLVAQGQEEYLCSLMDEEREAWRWNGPFLGYA